jgi:hypothetical protein
VDKKHILEQIGYTAADNGGVPLGRSRFQAETGIRESDWRGRFWARWSDAVREAGFVPNARNPRTDDSLVFSQLASFIRELGRYPTVAELRLRKRRDQAFPGGSTLEARGSKAQIAQHIMSFCERSGDDWADVVAICTRVAAEIQDTATSRPEAEGLETGYVYLALMKVGRERRYKIGKANLVAQRARQVSVNLPEELELIHAISTDDAYGIEAYWHRRFADQRRGGEWFALTGDDVRAFKRRRFM